MELTKSILTSIRESVGLTPTAADFDGELIPHINSAIAKLNQSGVGRLVIVKDEVATWNDLQDPNQTAGNAFFQLVPLYITLSTKLLFDPPPPSSVEYHSSNIQELLWRLKLAYDPPLV